MKISREAVLAQLKNVIDPVTKLNIVESGILSYISIDDGDNVKFSLEIEKDTLTQRQFLINQCQEMLEKNIDNIGKVSVTLTNKSQIADNVIMVASGKGGVGKSTIALNIAIGIAQLNYRVGLIDADIYGPSIPHMLNIKERTEIKNGRIIPHEKYKIKSVSIGYLIPANNAIIWRGPMITKSLSQMILGTNWGKLDYMVIDTPPGTGDVHISLSKMCKISSAIIVSTPQELAVIDAIRACDMFKKLNIRISGVVENMSHIINNNGNIEYPFGDEKALNNLLSQFSITRLGKIPFIPSISSANSPPILDLQTRKGFTNIVNSII